MRMLPTTILWAIGGTIFLVGTTAWPPTCSQGIAQQPVAPTSAPPAQSMDQQLLENAEMQRPRPPEGPTIGDRSSAEAAAAQSSADSAAIDPGGTSPTMQAMRQVVEHMRKAQQQLAEPDLSATLLARQDEILTSLDRIITSLRDQQHQQSRHESTAGQPEAESQQQAGQGPASSEQLASENATDPSADEQTETEQPERHLREALEEYWGHLPERLRTQMQNSGSVGFLPQYRELIEAYYRRLAEDRSDQR